MFCLVVFHGSYTPGQQVATRAAQLRGGLVIHQSASRQELIRLLRCRHATTVQSEATEARHRQDQIVRRGCWCEASRGEERIEKANAAPASW